MSAVRAYVEWLFTDIVKYFKFLDFKENLRIGLSRREGASLGSSRVNIGRLITTSVTSRHTSMFFKMAGNFLVRYFCKR